MTRIVSARLPLGSMIGAVVFSLFVSSAVADDRVGAIEGDFSVNAIGSATYHIPLRTVPASGGIRPDVSLVYSSGASRSWAGEGWGLSGFSSIERCPQAIDPDGSVRGVDFSSEDRFCLDGSRLVLETGTYGQADSTYRTEVDQFTRITAHQEGGQNPAYFELRYPNGSRAFYGNEVSARVEVQGTGGAGTVRSWLIDKFVDQFGNEIRYRYTEDNATGEVYPRKVEWGLNGNARPNPGVRYRLHFVWKDRPASDTWEAYLAGAKRTMSKRLASIRSQYVNGGTHQFIRTYSLNYASPTAADSGHSRLISVQECNEFSGECLPTTRFEWAIGSDGWQSNASNSPTTATRPETSRVADVNNDGRSDLIVATPSPSPVWRLMIATPSGDGFGEWTTSIDASAATDTYVIDYNGDDASDLLVPDGNWKVYQSTGGTQLSSTPIDTQVPAEGLSFGVRVADFDGDGLEDLLYGLESGLYLRRRDPSGTFSAAELVGDRFFVDGTDAYYTHIRDARLVDFDGDGRNDLIARTGSQPDEPDWLTTGFCIQHPNDVPLNWTPAGAAAWDVEVRDIGGSWSTLLDDHNFSSYNHNAAIGAYEYQVRGISAEGIEGPWSVPPLQMIVEPDCGGGGGGENDHVVPSDPIIADWSILRYTETPTGGRFVAMATLANIANPLPIDLNGDGLTDLAYSKGGTWRTRLSTGTGLTNESNSGFNADHADTAFVADINRDGRQDVAYYRQAGSAIEFVVLRSDGKQLTSSASELQVAVGDAAAYADAGRVHVVDGNADGYRDVVVYDPATNSWRQHLHASAPSDLIERITDGFAGPGQGDGNEILIDYLPLAQVPTYTSAGANFPSERNYTGPMRVVFGVTRNDGVGSQYTQGHFYKNARISAHGRGFLGFGERKQDETREVPTRLTRYRQDFPYIGRPHLIQLMKPEGGLIEETTIEYSQVLLNHPDGESHLVWPSMEKIERYEVDGPNGGQKISTVTSTIGPSGINTAANGFGEVLARTITADPAFVGEIFTTEILTSYHTQTSDPCVLPDRVTVTRSSPSSSSTRVSQAVSVDWSNCTVSQFNENVGQEPDVRKTLMLRDLFGNVTQHEVWAGDGGPQSKGPRRVTTVQYDDFGQYPLTTTIDPNGLNLQRTLTWDYKHGRPATVLDVAGLLTQLMYDSFGQIDTVIRPDGTYVASTREWCSNGFSNLHACGQGGVMVYETTRYSPTYPAGIPEARSSRVLDTYGRAVGEYGNRAGSDNHYPGRNFRYDDRGNLVQASSPVQSNSTPRHWATMTYDVIGRRTSISEPVDQNDRMGTTTIRYLRDRIEITNPENAKRMVVIDALGRTIETIDPDPLTGALGPVSSTYAYSDFDELEVITDPLGFETVMTYDGLGRRRTLDDPNSGLWHFDYNIFDELLSQTSPKQHTTTSTYDDAGRLTYRQHVDFWREWTYDTAQGKGRGQLHTVRYVPGFSGGAQETETFAYDEFGRMSSRSSGLLQAGFSYTYDDYSRLRTISYPTLNGDQPYSVTYTYDGRGRTATVDDSNNKRLFEAAASWPHNLAGDLTNFTIGNGVSVRRSFDEASGVHSVSKSTAADNTIIHVDRAKTWSKTLNITQRQDTQYNSARHVFDEVEYDFLDRLTSVTTRRNSNTLGTVDVEYDAIGNIEYKSDVGDYTYSAGQPDRLASVINGSRALSYAYDDNGNVQSKSEGATATTNIQWASFDRPIQIERDGNTVDFAYGADLQALHTTYTTGAGESEELWEFPNGLAVYRTAEGGRTQYYVPVEGMVIGAVDSRSGEVTYYHYNVQGSLVTTSDESGGLKDEMRFDAFGKRRKLNGSADTLDDLLHDLPAEQLPGYTGHQQLDAVGLVHMRARVYDPTTSRFMSIDPLMRDVFDSRSRNGYSYVENNPLTLIDPTGMRGDGADGLFDFCFGFGCGFRFTPIRFFAFFPRPGGPRTEMPMDPDTTVASTAFLANLDTLVLGNLRDLGARSRELAGQTALAVADLKLIIDDRSDTYFISFYAGRVVQEFILVPVEEVAISYRDGDVGGVVWAVGSGVFKPARAADKVADRAKAARRAEDSAPETGFVPKRVPDDALVARGGTAANHTPEKIDAAIGPSRTPGVEGFSAQCDGGTCLSELGQFIPNKKLGVTTAGEIRAAGGDVVRTPGFGHHVTVTDLPGEAASPLFREVLNPNPLKRQ